MDNYLPKQLRKKVKVGGHGKINDDLLNYVFSFDGFGIMFSTALFSQLFQHSVPGLIRPLPEPQKKKVKRGETTLDKSCRLLL